MRPARTLKPAVSRCASTFPPFPDAIASGLMIASVSTVPSWSSGSENAAHDVAAGDESYQHAFPHHRESIHVLVDHHGGHIGEGLILGDAEHRPIHDLPDRERVRIDQLGLFPRLGDGGIFSAGALHEIGK